MNNTPLTHSRNMVNPGLHMLEDERGGLFPTPALAKINPAGKFPPHEKMAQSAKRRNKKTEEDKGSWRGMKPSTAAISALCWHRRASLILLQTRRRTSRTPIRTPFFFLYFNWQFPRMIKSVTLH